MHLEEVVVFVRIKNDENQRYLDSLEEIKGTWLRLVNEGKIRKLRIYSYDSNPEHYYVIIGDSIVLTGLVYHDDESNPTGTSVDLEPIVISDKMKDGKDIIKKYNRHFDDLMRRYEKKIVTIFPEKK